MDARVRVEALVRVRAGVRPRGLKHMQGLC